MSSFVVDNARRAAVLANEQERRMAEAEKSAADMPSEVAPVAEHRADVLEASENCPNCGTFTEPLSAEDKDLLVRALESFRFHSLTVAASWGNPKLVSGYVRDADNAGLLRDMIRDARQLSIN